jgi:hypothetical protein
VKLWRRKRKPASWKPTMMVAKGTFVYLSEAGALEIEEGSQWSIHSELVKRHPKNFRPRFSTNPVRSDLRS